MRKISMFLVLILLYLCSLTYQELGAKYINETKQCNYQTIVDKTVYQKNVKRETFANVIFFLIIILLFVTVLTSNNCSIDNIRHIYCQKKHIKHLPRANILNPGITM